ncbi:MAG: DUF4910 domain-containing protein [bacterium]
MLKNYITNIVNECGPRISGSESDKKAIELIKGFMSRSCDKVEVEEFEVAPRVLQRLTEVITYAVLASFVLFFISPVISFIVGLGFGVIFFMSRWFDIEIIDRFMDRKKSANVIGIIKPKGEIKRRFIVSGHHDSAFNMTLLHRQFVWLTPVLEFFTTVSMLGMIALSVYAMAKGRFFYPIIHTKIWAWTVLFGFLGAITSQIMRKGLVSDIPVEGANDNLSGVATAIGFAEYLAKNKPLNTEVFCISFGAEEPNTKGSQAFVKRHLNELKSIPTYVLNFDMVGGDGVLRVVKKELEVRSTHSKDFVNFVCTAAQKGNVKVKKAILPFGNTDATPFSRKGILATSIVRLDATGLPGHWHTPEDTVKNIKEDSLTECVELSKAVLIALENQQ